MDELTEELSRPFSPEFIDTVKKGNRTESYINHAVITHRLNEVLGVGEWSFRIVEIPTFLDDNGRNHVLHVLGEISLGGGIPTVRQEIGVPSRISSYDDEVKAAVSDAVKRCAMRLGVGIQLWHDIEKSSALPSKSATPLGGTASAEASGGAQGATFHPPDTPSDGGAPVEGEASVPAPSSDQPFDAIDKMNVPSFDAIAAMLGGRRSRAKEIINEVNGTSYTAATIKDATDFERKLAIAAIEEGAS